MTERTSEEQASNSAEPGSPDGEEKEEFKIYIGRVPGRFKEKTIKRILAENLGTDGGDDVVEIVELIYAHDEDGSGDNHDNQQRTQGRPSNEELREERQRNEKDPEKEHRGFGFVSFKTAELRDSALKLGTVRGGRKSTSKKLHTMYLRPYVALSDDTGEAPPDGGDGASCVPVGRDVCYLWSLFRCPYGDGCKFRHAGEGGCKPQESDLGPDERKQLKRKQKGKCFVYKKKGRCPKGDDCPFSHDFEPDATAGGGERCVPVVPQSQKDCINWKTKGKCRKGDACPYKHDPELRKKALEKKQKRQRAAAGGNDGGDDGTQAKRPRKEKQPISVRVFGLNYDTTEHDVRKFMEATAGHPVKSIVFPRFEDSGRSKGYCGVYFASPKASKDAVEKCDGAELHGRWLRVQTGKSMTVEQWEGLHHKS
ncbi:unnamed protein product [Pseudo-nitzschia multistriata]|uniref:Uncharacterized protein n=1 Tax=Pseudo-nitzschia multistriata TaxID=183589 RepID=A0A448ZA33_9STRA|nr:unnamed protein product [Pseudo-nitzschia multistriata]